MPDDMKVARYAEIADRLDALKSEHDKLQAEHDQLEAALLLQFQESGQQAVVVNGRNVHLRSQIWASPEKDEATGATDYDAVCDAFDSMGLPFAQRRFNAQTVSAWVREQPVDDETLMPVLPAPLVGKLHITRKWSLAVTKAAVRKSRSGA